MERRHFIQSYLQTDTTPVPALKTVHDYSRLPHKLAMKFLAATFTDMHPCTMSLSDFYS